MVKQKRLLRNNPFSIIRTFEKARQVEQAKLASQRTRNPQQQAASSTLPTPSWLPAVSLYPPPSKPLRQVIPTEVGHFGAQSASNRTHASQVAAASSLNRTNLRSLRREIKAASTFQAPVISYPEDELRELFFKEHPFELRRPRCLVEMDGEMKVKPSQEWPAPGSSVGISGEDVIQKALYLQSAAGGSHSRQIAYNLALASFYKHRAQEDRNQLMDKQRRVAEQKNLRLQERQTLQNEGGAAAASLTAEEDDTDVYEDYNVAWFRVEEEKALAASAKYLEKMNTEMAAKRQVQEEMAKYEARNMKKEEGTGPATMVLLDAGLHVVMPNIVSEAGSSEAAVKPTINSIEHLMS
ncbi:mitochondrial ribosomal small subunit component [Blyttiomyces sp. JEL0837]|nr:mitochondrial ribosomal small subunit component [Blyttiomyces sp. JEL0837]